MTKTVGTARPVAFNRGRHGERLLRFTMPPAAAAPCPRACCSQKPQSRVVAADSDRRRNRHDCPVARLRRRMARQRNVVDKDGGEHTQRFPRRAGLVRPAQDANSPRGELIGRGRRQRCWKGRGGATPLPRPQRGTTRATALAPRAPPVGVWVFPIRSPRDGFELEVGSPPAYFRRLRGLLGGRIIGSAEAASRSKDGFQAGYSESRGIPR